MQKDAYDRAVELLSKNPSQIAEAWDKPLLHPAGILFQVASPTGNYQKACDTRLYCGDLCEIASGDAVAYTDEMTSIIREDERIPMLQGDCPNIAVEHLELFAEWQRLFDLTWNRNPEEVLRDNGLKL